MSVWRYINKKRKGNSIESLKAEQSQKLEQLRVKTEEDRLRASIAQIDKQLNPSPDTTKPKPKGFKWSQLERNVKVDIATVIAILAATTTAATARTTTT